MPFKSFEAAAIEVGGTVSSVFVVHGTPLVRLGIASALRPHAARTSGAIVAAGKLADVAEALGQARHGDILVCDFTTWSALERDATGLLAHTRAQKIGVCLVACTDDSAHRMLQLRGVSGVVSTDCGAEELEQAVDAIHDGRTHFKTESRLAPPTGMAKLSSRQVEILELMTRGLLNKQIAWELGVTEGTVKSHVSAILEKLGCDRRTQAIAAFLQCLGVGNAPTPRSLNA